MKPGEWVCELKTWGRLINYHMPQILKVAKHSLPLFYTF